MIGSIDWLIAVTWERGLITQVATSLISHSSRSKAQRRKDSLVENAGEVLYGGTWNNCSSTFSRICFSFKKGKVSRLEIMEQAGRGILMLSCVMLCSSRR